MELELSEGAKRDIFSACDNFLNGNYPVDIKYQLEDLAAYAGTGELSDFYGKGPLIEDFESEIAHLLGKSSALFLPSGTMAQLIGLRIWCDRKNSRQIAMHATSHLALHEQSAYKHLHGLDATFLGQADRPLTLENFEATKVDYSAVVIELPQRELGGTLPDWNELRGMSEFCKRNDVSLHLDGARLWETSPFYKKTYTEICSLFDSVYVSFYKGLGGMAGAALVGATDFIDQARIWQRRYGGNLIKLFPYIISARAALKLRLPKMALYHKKAIEIAESLNSLNGIKIEPSIPAANMMHITFDRDAASVENAFLEIAKDLKIAGFYRLQPVSGGQKCKAELTIGDATLDLSTERIVQVFERVLRSSSKSK